MGGTSSNAPESICLLRLSALGDCANMVPVVHTLRQYWPDTRISWVINRFESRFVADLPGVEFLVCDKKDGRSGRRALRRQLRGRRFDVLCHMHASMRANMISRLIPARLKLGFNRERSRDLQRLFVHETIDAPAGRHVLDGYFAFLAHLGLQQRVLDWSLPVSDEARDAAARRLPGDDRWLLISPASSHVDRNWHAVGYAAVADHAVNTHGMRVALIGGPSAAERQLGDAIIEAARVSVTNLIGDSPLPQLVPLLSRAAMLVTPDSGPAHIANATDTPVVALHAATESARSGPYKSLPWCVDRYADAARRFKGRPAGQLPWGTKIEQPGVMDLITVADVIERVDAAVGRVAEI